MDVVARELRIMMMPALPAALTVAGSPCGWAMRWKAVGAMITGMETGWPSTVVERLRSLISRSTRYFSLIRP
jgi:hypothetical protein